MTHDEMLIRRALNFAAKAHGRIGQLRKCTDIPYIVHPVEVWQILRENGAGAEVQAAGLLHDCIEDTGVTADEIEKVFGGGVRKLVEDESEDKMLNVSKKDSWKARKQATIDHMKSASKESMMICCADKLSNLRSMAFDLEEQGESLWDRFNAGKADIGWYYSSIIESIKPLAGMAMYEELKSLTKEVFA